MKVLVAFLICIINLLAYTFISWLFIENLFCLMFILYMYTIYIRAYVLQRQEIDTPHYIWVLIIGA